MPDRAMQVVSIRALRRNAWCNAAQAGILAVALKCSGNMVTAPHRAECCSRHYLVLQLKLLEWLALLAGCAWQQHAVIPHSNI